MIILKEKNINFSKDPRGLYVKDDDPVDCDVLNQNAIKDYTSRQVVRAQTSRKPYHNLNSPTTEDIKTFPQQKIRWDNPVTVRNLDPSDALFRIDIATLNGKETVSYQPAVTTEKN